MQFCLGILIPPPLFLKLLTNSKMKMYFQNLKSEHLVFVILLSFDKNCYSNLTKFPTTFNLPETEVSEELLKKSECHLAANFTHASSPTECKKLSRFAVREKKSVKIIQNKLENLTQTQSMWHFSRFKYNPSSIEMSLTIK